MRVDVDDQVRDTPRIDSPKHLAETESAETVRPTFRHAN
jgi:hypothetical protein